MNDMMLGSALLLGLATSMHCAGMCGPLACSLVAQSKPQHAWLAPTLYHLARLTSYTVLGALAGGLSQAISGLWTASPLKWLPWVFVAALLCHAFGWEKYLPKPKILQKWWFRQKMKPQSSAVKRAALVGIMTPLLPCGPLYLFFGVSLATGSALKGASLALAFGLGTVPLLWIAQTQWMWLQRKLGAITMAKVRRGLTLLMAGFLMWRLQDVTPFQTQPIEPFCPLCEGYQAEDPS